MFIKYLLIFIIFVSYLQHHVKANKQKKVVCYHGSWSRNRKSLGKFVIDENMDPFLCTHLIYAFNDIQSTGHLGANNAHCYIKKFNDLKLKNPELKTLLSVGGWKEGSTNFSIVAADAHKRATFLNNTIDFLQTNKFNGLDIDWEYPNQRHDLQNNDRENFVVWLQELKQGFKPYGLILTAAVKAVAYAAELSYNVAEMAKHLDFFNIMSYNMNGLWSPGVGVNTPLYAGALDLTERAKQRNFNAIAKYWIQQGVPRDKIVMGIVLYGLTFTLENSNNHNIGANHSGPGKAGPYTKQSGILAYYEICENVLKENSQWHLEWDSNQLVPYAYNDEQWVGYEDVRSIALKADYVNREMLGGIMIWTVELDDFRGVCGATRYPLLTMINKVLFEKDGQSVIMSKRNQKEERY